MKINELIEDIEKKMPPKLDDSIESEIIKALLIYIELGKKKSFNEKYYFGNSKTRAQIYRMAKEAPKNISKIAEEKKLVCIELSHLYKYILGKFGIKADVVRPDMDDEHEMTVITLSNGDKMNADLQSDLERIHTQSRLREFASGDLAFKKVFLNQEVMDKLCNYLGYAPKGYKDDVISELKERVQNLSSQDALKEIINHKEILDIDSNIDYVEFYKYYTGVLKEILPKDVKSRINYFSCYKEDDNRNRDYTLCVYSEFKNDIDIYMYSKKNREFMPISLEKIQEFENNGLHLGAYEKENGVSKLRKYAKKQIKEHEDEEIDQ